MRVAPSTRIKSDGPRGTPLSLVNLEVQKDVRLDPLPEELRVPAVRPTRQPYGCESVVEGVVGVTDTSLGPR